jgi:hypothetical protein
MIPPTIQFGRSIDEERANTLVTEAGLTALQDYQWFFKSWYDRIWDDDMDDGVEHAEPVCFTAGIPTDSAPDMSAIKLSPIMTKCETSGYARVTLKNAGGFGFSISITKELNTHSKNGAMPRAG